MPDFINIKIVFEDTQSYFCKKLMIKCEKSKQITFMPDVIKAPPEI